MTFFRSSDRTDTSVVHGAHNALSKLLLSMFQVIKCKTCFRLADRENYYLRIKKD